MYGHDRDTKALRLTEGEASLQETITWPDTTVSLIYLFTIFTGVDPQHTWDLSTYRKT